jgi:formate dehydrogenase subunit delta
MSPDKLAYMANQIGAFFANQGEERAVMAIADHLTKFWDPRMRTEIVKYVNDGGDKLKPFVLEAVRRLEPAAFETP